MAGNIGAQPLPGEPATGEPWARLPLTAFASRLFDRVDAAVLVVDLAGVVLYANPYCEFLYGRAPSDLVGRQASDFALTPVSPALRREISAALNAGSSWEGQFAVRRSDGSVAQLHAIDAPVFDASGALTGVITLATDRGDLTGTQNRSRRIFAVAQILNDIGDTLVAGRDPASVMSTVTAAARRLTGAWVGAYLERLGAGRDEFAVLALTEGMGDAASDEQPDGAPATVAFTAPALRAAFGAAGPTRFDDVRAAPGDAGELDQVLGRTVPVRSCIVAPVRSRAGLLVGAMVIGDPRPGRFGPEEERALADIVAHAGILLDMAEIVRAAETEIAARTRAEEVQRFYAETGALLSWSFDYPEMFERLARLCVPFLGDLCLIDVAEAGGIRRVAAVHADPEKAALVDELGRRFPPDPFGLHPAASVVRGGRPQLAEDMSDEYLRDTTRDDEHFRIVKELGFTSYICVPLTARGRTLGALTLVSAGSGRRFGPQDLELAEEVARRAALTIDNARLYAERDYVARALQSSLLPPSLPSIPGVHFTARYRAVGEGSEVGGDFYDVFRSGRNAWWFVIGDVSGKGPRAASIAGIARHTLRAVSMERRSPKGLLSALHATLVRGEGQGEFCTVCTALLRPSATGAGARLVVACGGHPPPIVRRANGALEVLTCNGPLLGVPVRSARFVEQTLTLEPGDTVVLYTDGIVEAHHPDQPVFGEKRLMEAIGDAGDEVDLVADAVIAAVRAYGPDVPRDDLAVVVAQIAPPAR